jgi:hypothetical protein
MRAGTPAGFVALAQGQFIDEPMAGIGVTYVHEGETFNLTSNAAGYFYVEAKEGSGVTPPEDLNQKAAAVDLSQRDMAQVLQRDASQLKQQVGVVDQLRNAISGIVPVGRGERELIAGDQMTFTAAGVQLGDTIDGSVKFAGDRSGKFQVYPVTLTNDDSLLDDRALTIMQFLQSIKTTEADIVRVDRHPEIATFARDNDIVALDDNTLAPLVGAGSLNIIDKNQAAVATENWALNVRKNVNALDVRMK